MTETLKLISPVDGSVYAERPTADAAAVDRAVSAAKAAQRDWAATPLDTRVALCLKALDALLAMNDEIVPELTWQMGRPVRYGGEKGGLEERARYMAGIAAGALAPIERTDRPGFKRYLTHEPLGVVMVIAPWNYPYLTAGNTIFPALMAGNAVLLKHAAQTLLVGERFAMAFEKAGLPKGVFQNIVLSHDGTETLLGSGLIDHVNFTGSVAGGKAIEKALAGTFATLGLELGGKDPAYVMADANLDYAVANLVDGAFYNSGQCCCGIERIYVHESRYDAFVDGFVNLTRQYTLGNPLDPETTIGPMAQARFAAWVREQTEEALRKGAKAHIDTAAFPADKAGTPYLAPQVLTNVNHQMSVMREESFGPVVGIMKVKDDAEAIQLMNDSPYGLTASIWTEDLAAAEHIGHQIDTGTVFMNRCDYVDPGLVWTGVKDTGKGAALSEIGFANLTRPKSFHLRVEH
ncbi:aldehyde dehydrogenase family protein [Polymorphum gilvum]|uniref:Putative aldehyde dehydrogenase 1A1-like protein n=1 Tax=Polymorphum gilvum (strain LMG 25793 / CGMCC 1.9160 / SL003B-26A1) TaxID=991905 RepID=F2J1S2_POLGS|nr:aldehyde dehydrogenase family protein [Polymorphum gilvum]ADZ71983.1 putative aldehyde dehydrogenase 1A1-like protein [Polymorphum gilvum SL003B-26A1]